MTPPGSRLPAALAAFASALALAGLSGPAQAKKLTCSFIEKQCVQECSKEAARGFCVNFCGAEKQNCLSSGNWDTMGRKFSGVIKK